MFRPCPWLMDRRRQDSFIVGCQMLVSVVIAGLLFSLWILSVSWAVGDAQRRGQAGGWVIFLFVVFGPFAALIWRIIRPRSTIYDRSPEDYNTAEEALAAATKFEMLGDWETAVEVLELAATRWPENQNYIHECLLRIQDKKALT